MRDLALGALLALTACGEPSPQPHADTSTLDTATKAGRERRPPDNVQLAQYVDGCPPRPPIPPVSRAIFDFYLGALQATRTPTDADVGALQARGARVLPRFHVDAVRAETDTATARALVTGPDKLAEMATQVWDSTGFTVPLMVFYSRPFTVDDSAFLARLTGRAGPPTRRPRPVVYVELEDSVIPVLLRAPGVAFARARTFGCGYVNGPPVEPPAHSPPRMPQN